MADKYRMTPDERDLMVRTVLGEAADQGDDGQAAVAHVIMNRLRSGRHGSDVPGVVLAPKQFEPWQTRPRELMGIDPKSKAYQRAVAVVDRVAGGEQDDPTGGATHFLDEGIVRRRRGGSLPSWADGNGLKIGDHTFYAPEGRVRALGYGPATTIAGDSGERRASTPSGERVAQAGVTQADIDDTLRAAGLAAPSAAAPIQPSSARPAAPSQDDLAETARQAGISLGPVAKPAPLPEPAPSKLGPKLQPEAERTARDVLSPMTAGVTETSIVGPLATSAASALRARPGREPTVPGETFGERYANSEATLREAQRLYAEQNPKTNLLAGLLGNTAMTTMGALGSWGTPGRVMQGLEGPNIWSKIVTGGAGGGATGMMDAAMRGENPISGLEVGAAGGAGGPVAGELFKAGTNVLSQMYGPGGVLRKVSPVAIDKLTGALEGETPASIAAARARMGPQGFLGDLNTGMTDIAGGLADIPGAHKQVVREAYRLRAKAQPSRIDAALTQAVGPHADIEAFKRFTTESRKAAADPLYEQFRTMQVEPTAKLLDDIMPRLEKAGAFKMAEELAGVSGHKMDRMAFTKNNNPTNYPTAETWDFAKRGLDRRIDQAYTAGDKTLARELVNLKHEMIAEIEKTNAGSVWKQARQEFASRSAILDQVEAGRDTFLGGRSGTSVDELRHELKGLGGPELAARLQGLRSAADEVMGETIRGDTTLRNKMLAPNNQKKLRLLLGDQKADELIQTMDREKFLMEQRDNVAGGSQTTPKKERVNALLPAHGATWNPSLTEPLSWVPPSVREGFRPTNILDAWRGQRHGSALNQLGDIITTPEGPQIDTLLAAISKEGRRRSRVENFANPFAQLVSGAISGPGAATARRHYFPPQ